MSCRPFFPERRCFNPFPERKTLHGLFGLTFLFLRSLIFSSSTKMARPSPFSESPHAPGPSGLPLDGHGFFLFYRLGFFFSPHPADGLYVFFAFFFPGAIFFVASRRPLPFFSLNSFRRIQRALFFCFLVFFLPRGTPPLGARQTPFPPCGRRVFGPCPSDLRPPFLPKT